MPNIDPDHRPVAIITHWEKGAHDGPGWYFYAEEDPDDGSTGAFATADEAKKQAEDDGYAPRYSHEALRELHPPPALPVVPGAVSKLTPDALAAKRDEMAVRSPQPGSRAIWPTDFPPTCLCNPPAHTGDEITRDGSFHARWCPEHPTNVPTPRV